MGPLVRLVQQRLNLHATSGIQDCPVSEGAKVSRTTARAEPHHLRAMLEYLLLLLSLIRATVRDREALIAENLLLRHQLTLLTRPTRKRPRLRTRDKLFWVVARLSAATGAGTWRGPT